MNPVFQESLNRYVYPLIDHPVARVAYQVVAESIKVIAATVFLRYVTRHIFNETKLPPTFVFVAVIAAPLIEELVFRGFIQRGIRVIQEGWDHFIAQRAPAAQDLEMQRIFRVKLTSLLFAAAHLTNSHSSLVGKVAQFTACYYGSLGYGYISEKYKTLSLPIFAHGMGNLAVCCAMAYPQHHFLFLTLYIVNDVAVYLLGTTPLAENIASKAKEVITYGLALPERCLSWLRPNALTAAVQTA